MPTLHSIYRTLVEPLSLKVTLTCLVWYAVSSMTSQLTKEVLTAFPHPVAVAQMQFFLSVSYCVLFSSLVARFTGLRLLFPKGSVPLTNTPSSPLIISRTIFRTTLPMGVFQFAGKFFSLAATSAISVASVSSIKALSPLLIVSTYRFFYHVVFPTSTYLSLVPLVVGVVCIVVSDSISSATLTEFNHDHIKGVIYAMISAIIFSTQNIYAKKVVSWNASSNTDPASLAINTVPSPVLPLSESLRVQDKEKEKEKEKERHDGFVESTYSRSSTPSTPHLHPSSTAKPDKLTVLMYCSGMGFLLSFPAFIIDLPQLIASLNEQPELSVPFFLLFLNGTSHFVQALLAFHLLGTIPTVTYSVASMLKRIVIITVSMAWAGHPIDNIEWSGLFLIGFGLYCYDRWGNRR